jgi:diguanylate cyclase (GGDEF)-like protein
MVNDKIKPEDYLVLVCDDEEAIRALLGEALGSWNFQVATAPNAEAALDYLKAGNIPHIILTDIRMGQMNGIELAEAAKKMSDEIEVIIMTSQGTFETAVQAMRIGVFDYISKPFENIEDVRTTLLHVAERIYMRYYTEFLVQELHAKNAEIERLAVMSSELSQTLDLVKTIEIGVKGISEAFGSVPTLFVQYIPSQKSLMVSTRWPLNLFGQGQVVFPLPDSSLGSQRAIAEFIHNLHQNTEFLLLLEQAWGMNPPDLSLPAPNTEGKVASWSLEPLITRDIPRGVFACLGRIGDSDEAKVLLRRYVQTISTNFENALLHAKVVQSAIRDSMTGLYNVRYFKERFVQEIQAASRVSLPMSLLFFDVDHFKKYNDTHGHPAGDVVLKKFAELLKKSFRGTDIPARYGGEEFVVAMPHTSFVDALEKAEKFRALVEKEAFPNEHTQPLGRITVSIGVAEFPSHGGDMDTIIKAADEALYEAKKKSRNVVLPGIAAEGYLPAFESKGVRTRPGFLTES